MENNATAFETLIERAEAYGKTTVELVKLKAVDKVSELLSTLIQWMIVIIVVALFFIVLNIGIAMWLGELLGEPYYGFFIVAGFYALLALGCMVWLKKPLNNALISKMVK